MKDEDFGIKDIGTLPDGRFYYVEAIQFTYRIIPFLASIITFIAILFLKKIPVIGSRIQKKKKVVTDTNYQQNTVVEKSNYVNDNDGGSSITETNENNEKTINIPNEVEKEEPKKEHQVGFSNTVEINNNETKVVEFSENTENPVSENDNRYSKRLSYRYSNRFSRYSNRYSNGFDNRASHRYSRYDNRCSTYNKNRISYIFTQMNAVLMDDEDEEDDNDDDDEVLEEEEGVEVTLF
ncbi:hypothetical protein BCR32DRAFT_241124 [Anaeromyces robustus]|uniref:Uncharacterized protein n=1 Tax=Anaeromyces robustus TaxID=1754192 RepID=A0A1Y1XKI6_9FUNG|nr:hypothetical protein BCR32DRAFT_241124 [Anaeromyces robustus]|eukprot:ORX86270.1 hypothetical protein BCR32DRAFT_241124 [Anaeromyces robustus]